VDGKVVLLLVGIGEVPVGPLLQLLELLAEGHAVVVARFEMDVLDQKKGTLTRCRIS